MNIWIFVFVVAGNLHAVEGLSYDQCSTLLSAVNDSSKSVCVNSETGFKSYLPKYLPKG